MEEFNNRIARFCNKYSQKQEPIEVSFRDIGNILKNPDRATHLIHSYPAKLLMHIPYFFLNNDIFSKPGAIVLDPFCGSGTVLLESLLAGRNAVGTDTNPLASLISQVKTSPLNIQKLKSYIVQLRDLITTKPTLLCPEVVNIDYWFLPHIKQQLLFILQGIKAIPTGNYRNFFLVCFSNIIKKVSLADPRVSVPVKLRINQYPEGHPLRKKTAQRLKDLRNLHVVNLYLKIIEDNVRRFESLKFLKQNGVYARTFLTDARFLNTNNRNGFKLSDGSIDLIITSPPYAGAQKYIRACSLSLGWLEMANLDEIRILKRSSIGREHYLKPEYRLLPRTDVKEADELLRSIYKVNELRAYIAANYLNEMRQALTQAVRTLKGNGFLILIVGNNHVCGREFRTQEYLSAICQQLGLEVVFKLIDDIRSYGLMTKRNKTASIIAREWVLVFRKVSE